MKKNENEPNLENSISESKASVDFDESRSSESDTAGPDESRSNQSDDDGPDESRSDASSDNNLDELLLDDDSDEESEFDEESNSKFRLPKKNSSISNIIRNCIMVVAAVVFLYSAFMLTRIFLDYKKGTDIYKSISGDVLTPENATYAPDDSNADNEMTGATVATVPFKYDHQALLDINSDGIGYIDIPSVSVQLPIVQGSDNDYYLTHTFNKVSNGAGALFEDSQITGGMSATHVIIYGHNMRNGSMFAELKKYLTPSFYQTPGNDVFYIYSGKQLLKYKIFAAYISEPISSTYTFNFSTLSALREYAQSMKELSAYNTGVDVSKATQLITLSTCTGDGEKRIIVQATLISKSPLE